MKIHVAVDTRKRRILSMKVSSDKIGNNRRFKYLVKESGKVSKVFGDSAYDSRDNYNFLAKKGIEPGIKPRKLKIKGTEMFK